MSRMRTATVSRTLAVLAVLAFVGACVTVNIYFPAAEVNKAADKIVEDVYGTAGEPAKEQKQGPSSSLPMLLASFFAPAPAHAQDATTVSNAAIRGLNEQVAANHQQLAPYYASGNVGVAADGSVALRDTAGLSVPQVAGLKRLIAADNAARQSLYAEVAKALNTPETGKVQAVFAAKWRDKAQPGWWIQGDDGAWRQK